MKLIVDKMPVTANECLFSATGTGKPRCRHDAKLCPLLRGEECPHLMVAETPVSVLMNPVSEPIVDTVAESKKRTTKRSTAKKGAD